MRSLQFFPACAVLCFLALSLASSAHAGLHVEIEGARLPVVLEGDTQYVSLGGFAAARFLEFEYSYIDDVYLLRNRRSDGGTSVLRFRPGDETVRVDEQETQLEAPPIEGPDGLLVPLKGFARLVLGAAAASAISVRPDEGPAARLLEVRPLAREGYTKMLFQFEGEPGSRLQYSPERREVEILFEGTALATPSTPINLQDRRARTIRLIPEEELLQVRVVVELTGPALAEGFYLESSNQYVLTLSKDQGTAESSFSVPESVSEADRAWFGRQYLGLDAAHGGGDSGALASENHSEKEFCLTVAREVRELCRQTGLASQLVRPDDRMLPMHTRVHQVNRAGFTAVVTFHARSHQPTQASTSPVVFHLPRFAQELSALAAGQSPWLESSEAVEPATSPALTAGMPSTASLRAPNGNERIQAAALAASLANSFQRRLRVQSPAVEDPGLMPAAQSLAPAVSIDLGPLEAYEVPGTPGFDRDPRRRRLVFAVYQGLLDYYRSRRTTRPASRTATSGPSRTWKAPAPTAPASSLSAEDAEREGLRRAILGGGQ